MNTLDQLDRKYAERAANALREARLAAGLSLRELGRLAGTSHATLLAYENGRKVPSVATFLRIMEASGFAVDFAMSPRVRYRDGLHRGDELIDVLQLAGQFPARVPRQMDYPKFPGD